MFGGIFKRKSRPDRNWLIRTLARGRLSLAPDIKGINLEDALAKLPESQLLGLPEATLATIVHSFGTMRQKGHTNQESLDLIEAFRCKSIPGAGTGHRGDLIQYLCYRISLEHPTAKPPFTKDLVEKQVALCKVQMGFEGIESFESDELLFTASTDEYKHAVTLDADGNAIAPCMECGTRFRLKAYKYGKVKCPRCGKEQWVDTFV